MPKLAKDALPNELLKYEREKRNWTLEDVVIDKEHECERIKPPPASRVVRKKLRTKPVAEEVDVKMVGKWERGILAPTPHYQRQLAAVYGRTVQELGYPPESTYPRIPFWHVPHRRNDYFTGRKAILSELHSVVLHRNQQYGSDEKKSEAKTERFVLQPQALVGLGGMGKSQIAREYAYRYAHEYQSVFWLRASSTELLASDFADLATRLNLAEKNEGDQSMRIEAVKEWFMHFTRWLLIFDGANELNIIRDFLPRKCFGHIMITTQSSVTGDLAKPIKVEEMPNNEAALLLLRQSKEIELKADETKIVERKALPALQIANLLGYLPLMLVQAGSFIERNPGSLTIYADLFRKQPWEYLRYRDRLQEYPHAVTKTFGLNFDKVSAASPVATDLLRLFAFLNPSAIPKELITEAALKLGPVLSPLTENPEELRWAMMELTNYSLIEQSAEENIYTIHPIVQLVIQDRMDEEKQRVWVERAVNAVHQVFPDLCKNAANYRQFYLDETMLPPCQRFLSQALACAHLIVQREINSVEAVELLFKTANYLDYQMRYAQAELLYRQSTTILEKKIKFEGLRGAKTLLRIAELCQMQQKYDEAEQMYRRGAEIIGPIQIVKDKEITEEVAEALNLIVLVYSGLASTYVALEKFEDAEGALAQALYILSVGDGINDIVNVLPYFDAQVEYFLAKGHYEKAEAVCEMVIGEGKLISSGILAQWYSKLAKAYFFQKKNYDEVEALLLHALEIACEVNKHIENKPFYADYLYPLGDLYEEQKKFADAEDCYSRALIILAKVLGSAHPTVLILGLKLIKNLIQQSKFDRAQGGLEIAEANLQKMESEQNPNLVLVLYDLGFCHHRLAVNMSDADQSGVLEHFEESKKYYTKAHELLEPLEQEHPNQKNILDALAELDQNRASYTEKL